MDQYKNILEGLIKRQMGILGRAKTEKILADTGIRFDFLTQSLLDYQADGKQLMQLLGERILQTGGEVALIGARVSVILRSSREGLELPKIFL